MKRPKILLLLLTILALTLRLYRAKFFPLLWDEAAIGYNAYSLLHTLRDEYGNFLPLIFKSFGDYKPGLYIYLDLPFITLLGLNASAVRLPSIIIGSLTPLFLYLLIKQISPKSSRLALISALVLAVNPYNIHFSRGAWETNILTAQLVLAAYFFYRALNLHKSKDLFISALIFASSLYTYQAGKMISLLLIIILFTLNCRSIILHVKVIITTFVLPLFLLALPLAYGLLFSADTNRLKVVSLFSYPRPQNEIQLITAESSSLDYRLFHNQSIFFLRNFFLRYFNHLSPRFLVFEGDWQSPRHSAAYSGVLLYPSLIFLVIGLFISPHHPSTKRLKLLFALWLLLAPVPAALTRDSVQAVRAMSFSIPLVFFIAFGLNRLIQVLRRSKFRRLILTIVIAAYGLSLSYYLDLYYHHTVTKSPKETLFGYRQAFAFVLKNAPQSNQIYFTDFYGQPYIYYLFYSAYPPSSYQSQARLTENKFGDTGKVEQIDNIHFTSPPPPSGLPPRSLAVYSHDEILRLNLDPKNLIPLAPIGDISTFYAYQN